MVKRRRLSSGLKARIKDIRFLIMDVDGVLTPGYIALADSGGEIKFFNVHDGFGLFLWRRAGLKSAIVTAGLAQSVMKRADYLKIDAVYQGIKDKLRAYKRLKDEFKLKDKDISFIGDDLVDLPILKRAGFACCVSNANKSVVSHAHYITAAEGGKGAVREVIDIILKAKGMWDKVTGDYFG